MKKILVIVMTVILMSTALVGCGKDKKEEKTEIKVAALSGPTGMGMAKLMDDDEQGKTANDYNFNIVGAPDEMVALISNKEVDIAAVPTNLAAVLYQKTEGKVTLLANNTKGVLYIVTNGEVEINSIEDLKGKKVYATGQATTPEYVLNYVLDKNGIIDEVEVEYYAEHSEVAVLMAQGKAEIALLPQPFVTATMMQNDKLKVALNMTEEWSKVSGGDSELVMGSIIVRTEFLEKNKEAVDKFLEEYKASTEYVNKNVEEASQLIEKYGIFKAAVAKKAIPECNITYIDGEEMKTITEGFYKILLEADKKSIGGKLPDEKFYYIK